MGSTAVNLLTAPLFKLFNQDELPLQMEFEISQMARSSIIPLRRATFLRSIRAVIKSDNRCERLDGPVDRRIPMDRMIYTADGPMMCLLSVVKSNGGRLTQSQPRVKLNLRKTMLCFQRGVSMPTRLTTGKRARLPNGCVCILRRFAMGSWQNVRRVLAKTLAARQGICAMRMSWMRLQPK